MFSWGWWQVFPVKIPHLYLGPWPGLCRQVSVLGHLQILQRCWSVGCCDSSPRSRRRSWRHSSCDMVWPCPTSCQHIRNKIHLDSLGLLGESMTVSFCKSLFTSLFRLSYNQFDRSTLRSMSTFCSSPSAPRHATPVAQRDGVAFTPLLATNGSDMVWPMQPKLDGSCHVSCHNSEKRALYIFKNNIWQCVKTLYPCSSHQNSW